MSQKVITENVDDGVVVGVAFIVLNSLHSPGSIALECIVLVIIVY